jgi:hypothetical protein
MLQNNRIRVRVDIVVFRRNRWSTTEVDDQATQVESQSDSESDRARAYTDDLWRDLTSDEVIWRRHENSSAIGWHLGHQAHVAHFMIRNLIAAEPQPRPRARRTHGFRTARRFRGALPPCNDSRTSAVRSPAESTIESTQFRPAPLVHPTNSPSSPATSRIVGHRGSARTRRTGRS